MAITVSQSPTQSINAAHSDLLYVVTSNSSSRDNYTFNLDICSQAGTLIQRFQQTPNLSGIGVFNANLYFDRQTYIPNDVLTSFIYVSSESINRNQVKFSESWSDTPSGDIILYNGVDDTPIAAGVAGDVSASNLGADQANYFVPAVVNRNESTVPYWDTSDFYIDGTATGTKIWLTDMPRTNVPIRSTDYMVLAAFNGENYTGSGAYNDIARVRSRQYSSAGSLLVTHYNTNITAQQNPNALRTTTVSTNFDTISGSFFTDPGWINRFGYYGVGPASIYNWSLNASAATYTLDTQGYNDGSINSNTTDVITFKLQDGVNSDCSAYDIYRLCWVNKYGGLDWFNFNGISRYNNRRQDENYTQGFIDYSITDVNTNPYNITNRGKNSFQTSQTQRRTLSTDFLTQEWADWLEGLFVSPSVYLVDDNLGFIPINLISADYQKKDDASTQKLKSYTVVFEYSNPRRPYSA